MANEENTTYKKPWYQRAYNYATSPEFLRKPNIEEWDFIKGAAKQGASFFQDIGGLGYNAIDLGGIIPGETGIEKFFLGKEGAKDDPNFGLIDFVKHMMTQKREGEFVDPLSEVHNNPKFSEYMTNLNKMVIGKKIQDMDDRLDRLVTEAGLTFDMIPEDIRKNVYKTTEGAWDFFNYIGGPELGEEFKGEFGAVVNFGNEKVTNYDQFYVDNSIMKMDWSDEENPMVIFGDMPKVDNGPFGLDLNLDPGYSGNTLNLTNLGKYEMKGDKLTRVQPSVQNWLSDWNENPDRFGGILQSAPGYEALGEFIDDKWTKNVAWQGHEFDFPEGIDSEAEKRGFLWTMYPLMLQGIGAPVGKALSTPVGKTSAGIAGTEVGASLGYTEEE